MSTQRNISITNRDDDLSDDLSIDTNRNEQSSNTNPDSQSSKDPKFNVTADEKNADSKNKQRSDTKQLVDAD